MSSRKIKQAKIKRALSRSYKGFMPVKEKIRRDIRSINKANGTYHLPTQMFEMDLNNLNLESLSNDNME